MSFSVDVNTGAPPMKTDKKQAKGEKDGFGRILLILEMLWDLLTIPR